MNLLMVGSNKAPGSWDIRGQQLGNALGARMTSAPGASDWDWADLVVLIKHAGHRFALQAHAAGVPIVWDALDFWQQPGHNDMPADIARQLLAKTIETIRPALVIGATQAMADAAGGVYLPHHSWRGLEPVPPQQTVTTIGYQGNAVFLGRWAGWLLQAAERRKWKVVINPEQVWQADILVSFRDGPWDGWMCREWKSGVKLVNALAAGRPIITQISAAARELREAPTVLCDDVSTLDAALDLVTPLSWRQQAVEHCREQAKAYRLPAIAERYRAILATVRTSCPA